MRSLLLLLSVLVLASTTLSVTPASAGPGVGGGYEKMPHRKAVKRRAGCR